MPILKNFLTLLNTYYPAITALSFIIGGFWAIIKYRENIRDKRFNTYHDLIDRLVNEQIQPDRVIKLDKQIATVYELRNFPRYFEVSIRILEGLLEDWKDGKPRIKKEIELSLAYMKSSWLVRKFKK